MKKLRLIVSMLVMSTAAAQAGPPEDCAGADLRRAVAACSIIIESGPTRQVDVPMAYFNRGRAYHLSGEQERAASDLLEALRLSPNYADALDMLGNALLQSGQVGAAIERYTQAIRLEPNRPYFHYNRGNAYAAAGDLASAVADMTTAIRLEPRAARIYHNRGVAYAKLGNVSAAIADFRQALSVDPDYDRARQALQALVTSPALVERK